jgi:hypothetical protein
MLLLASIAFAGSLAGVTVPDSATVGGKALVLNGMGLREKYFLDIYVGSLYLPAKTRSADEAISVDAPKRIEMDFIYREVTVAQMSETFDEAIAKNPSVQAQASKFAQLEGMLETVHAGDKVVLDYVPGTGITLTVKGRVRGTIPGADFMKAVWTVYLGPNPPTEDLTKGMLGG